MLSPRRARAGVCATAILLALLGVVAAVALTLPTLTGRVVDNANIIPAATRSAIEQKLADLEAKTTIQLVVATVTSLEGQEIEPYANQLFRAWKLGQAKTNNGVLLLVAPNERRVRIEVGYGLEGTLTDALSKVIIANAITPRFKAGDFPGGITRGVEDIITVLNLPPATRPTESTAPTADTPDWEKLPPLRLDSQPVPDIGSWAVLFLLIGLIILLIVSSSFRRGFFDLVMFLLLSGGSSGGGGYSSGGGFSGGGFSGGGGGGFSGGGGSSGGGGASGSW